jgi:hypothetical protein
MPLRGKKKEQIRKMYERPEKKKKDLRRNRAEEQNERGKETKAAKRVGRIEEN